MVLICPSGFHGDENLPMIEGVRRSNYESLVKSVFHRDHSPATSWWRRSRGSFRTEDGRKACSGPCGPRSAIRWNRFWNRSRQPTLVIWGANDRVLSDVPGCDPRGRAHSAGARRWSYPKCGHAPQIEKAGAGEPSDLAIPPR